MWDLGAFWFFYILWGGTYKSETVWYPGRPHIPSFFILLPLSPPPSSPFLLSLQILILCSFKEPSTRSPANISLSQSFPGLVSFFRYSSHCFETWALHTDLERAKKTRLSCPVSPRTHLPLPPQVLALQTLAATLPPL